MKVLVTGGAGFIGSHLVNRLVKEGYDVSVLDDFSFGKEENKNSNAQYIIRDIRDDLDDLKGYDVVFHLAALARIQPSFKNPLKTIDVNVEGTANICALAKNNDARLVYSGSSSYYGGVYLNPYAFTKWQGEEVCRLFNKVYNLSCSIARFFNVFGLGQPSVGPYATVVGIFEDQYLKGQNLTVTGDGNQRRDFTHVDDIVSGLVLMSKDNWNGEIFNLGTGNNYSINEIANQYNCKIDYIPKRPGEAQETLADISFSRKKIGFKPTIDIRNYVKDWIKNNPIF